MSISSLSITDCTAFRNCELTQVIKGFSGLKFLTLTDLEEITEEPFTSSDLLSVQLQRLTVKDCFKIDGDLLEEWIKKNRPDLIYTSVTTGPLNGKDLSNLFMENLRLYS